MDLSAKATIANVWTVNVRLAAASVKTATVTIAHALMQHARGANVEVTASAEINVSAEKQVILIH